jgi:hypothetical protein
VKRLLVAVGGVYLLFAIIGRFVEGMGATQCGCKPECWCQKPGLSTFRWVFPFRHHTWTAEEKRAFAELDN